jgi:hypothetical protein
VNRLQRLRWAIEALTYRVDVATRDLGARVRSALPWLPLPAARPAIALAAVTDINDFRRHRAATRWNRSA